MGKTSGRTACMHGACECGRTDASRMAERRKGKPCVCSKATDRIDWAMTAMFGGVSKKGADGGKGPKLQMPVSIDKPKQRSNPFGGGRRR